MAASTFMRASNMIQSTQSGISSYRQFFKVQGGVLAGKYLGAVIAFLAVARGIPHDLYIAIPLAVTSGYSFESLADKGLPLLVSGMRKDVPPPSDPPKPPDPAPPEAPPKP
jgi:hypothetical protein